jgi:hypothetical protein
LQTFTVTQLLVRAQADHCVARGEGGRTDGDKHQQRRYLPIAAENYHFPEGARTGAAQVEREYLEQMGARSIPDATKKSRSAFD